MYIRPWKYILFKHPQPGKISKTHYMELMQNLWTPEYRRLLKRLKDDIVKVHMLEIPDPSRRFYINTYWSKYGMVAVLLQSYGSVEARKAEAK